LPYCKTRTDLLLAGDGSVRAWGWSALAQHLTAPRLACTADEEDENEEEQEGGNAAELPEFFTKFKLRLAPGGCTAANEADGTRGVRELTAKYLAQLGACAIDAIRKQLGEHIACADIQWCLTVRRATALRACEHAVLLLTRACALARCAQVPAIWDDAAKATMRLAMCDAGLVRLAQGGAQAAVGSAHPLLMVLEPEAASIYCQVRSMPFLIHRHVCACMPQRVSLTRVRPTRIAAQAVQGAARPHRPRRQHHGRGLRRRHRGHRGAPQGRRR
jgi:hypothetical protein